MMKKREKSMMAKTLTAVADSMLTTAANSRCILLYHQPKQPKDVKRFRKF